MNRKTPEEVLKEVRDHHYANNVTRVEAGKMLGCSAQTVTNILAAKKYMNPKQAAKFAEVFGYHEAFLTSGEGGLMERDYEDIRVGSDFYNSGDSEIGNYFRHEMGNLIACRLLSLLDEDAYNAYNAFINFQDDKYLACLKAFLKKHPDRKFSFPGEE